MPIALGAEPMMTAQQVIEAFEGIRRAQSEGRYAPHKPLLLLLALARVQGGEPRLNGLTAIEPKLKELLQEFAPTSSVASRHYPFWHLRGDGNRKLWQIEGPHSLTDRPDGATPNLGELRQPSVKAGFSPDVFQALRQQPGLLRDVALRVLDAAFPETIQADIAEAAGLNLDGEVQVSEPPASWVDSTVRRRKRDPGFRDRVLRAYEYRCCVCGFDLRIGHMPAGLEAAHIQWHNVGGPDIEPNGLALCALHHKLFDLGVFTIEPNEHRVVFSQHAIGGDRGAEGELRHHGRLMLPPQANEMRPGGGYLKWNRDNVFKEPRRE